MSSVQKYDSMKEYIFCKLNFNLQETKQESSSYTKQENYREGGLMETVMQGIRKCINIRERYKITFAKKQSLLDVKLLSRYG